MLDYKSGAKWRKLFRYILVMVIGLSGVQFRLSIITSYKQKTWMSAEWRTQFLFTKYDFRQKRTT